MVLLDNQSLTLLTMVSKFTFSDTVLHIKTGVRYFILSVPQNNLRLEYCNEPYYKYSAESSESILTKTVWIRCKSEMEDGRFVLSK